MSSETSEARVLYVGSEGEAVSRALEGTMRVATVDSTDGPHGRIADENIDCLVCEDGPGAVSFVETIGADAPGLPVVFATADPERANEALAAGATDVLVRSDGLDWRAVLSRRIENVLPVGRARDGTEGRTEGERTPADEGTPDRVEDSADDGPVDRSAVEPPYDWDRHRLEAVVKAFPDEVYVLDLDGNFVSVAPRAGEETTVSGHDPGELVGEHVSKVLPESDLGRAAETLGDFLTGEAGHRTTLEVAVESSDGERIPREVHLSVLYDETGERAVGSVGVLRDIRARRDHERRLREEREFSALLLDTLDDVFYLIDENGDLVRWNESMRRVTGYTDAELEEMNALDFFEGADRERIADAIGTVLTDGTTRVEAEFVTKDGRAIPFEFRGARLEEPDGSLRGIVGIGRDVSDRKERETRLERQRDRVESVFDAGPYPMVRVRFDDEPVVRQVNDAFVEVFGFERQDVVGDPLDEYIVPDDHEQSSRSINELTREGEPLEREVVRETADGERRHFRFKSSLVDVDGATEAVGSYVDVTERKARIEKLDQIRENVTDVVWMSSPDKGSMEFVSESYETVWGRSTESLRQNPSSFIEAVHPEDRERVERAVATQADDPEGYDETYRVVQPDGEVRWVRDRGSGVYDEDGELTRIVGVATDITERRERQQELQETRKRMEVALEATKAVVWNVDLDSGDTSFYPSEKTLFGVDIGSYEEFLSQVHPEDRERVAAALDRGKERGSFDVEFRITRNDERRWIAGEGRVEYNDGTPVRVFGVSRDVTERKERERELELKDRAMDEAPVGITIRDAEDRYPVTYVNQGLTALTGYDAEELRGDLLSVLGGAETDREKIATLEAAMDREEPAAVTALLYRRDGTPFWSRISVSPVSDDGEVTHFVGFLQDVTETKEHEQEVARRLNEFGDVLAEELRTPVEEARTELAAARESDDVDLDDAVAWLERTETLIDDLTAVHSFDVKSRETTDATSRRGESG